LGCDQESRGSLLVTAENGNGFSDRGDEEGGGFAIEVEESDGGELG
jgi:hypothetical protein